MTRQKKIFFISHDSNLTGAPILLINLIELIAKTGRFEIEIVLARGGILEERFNRAGTVHVLKPSEYGQKKSITARVKHYLNYRRQLKKVYSRIRGADIVFNNTIVNGKLLPRISKEGIPIITYVHELDKVFDYFDHDNSASMTIQYSSHLFYPSVAVKNSLVSKRSVAAGKLSYLPYYFGDFHVAQKRSIREFNTRLSAGRLIPAAKFYVAGMGTANDRKGIDFFLETCRQTVIGAPGVCFVWIGDFDNEKTKESILRKVQESKLENNFIMTGVIPYSVDNLSSFDLFFLSSREDPYPLVVLEAAISGIPTLYFTGSGGIGEFVQQDAGWGIDNFDTAQAAALITVIINQPDVVDEKGKCAFDRVKKIHGDGNSISDIFVETINKIIAQ